MSFDTWVRDLETVVDAAGLVDSRSSGFPEEVRSYCIPQSSIRARHALGALRRIRGGNQTRRHVEIEARRARGSVAAWVRLNNPAFCKTFAGSSPRRRAARAWFDELQRVSTSPENAARLMERDDDIDVRPLLSQVKTPTLVIHCDRDRAVAPEKGRLLAGIGCPLRLPAERESPDARGRARLASIPRRARPVPELVTPFFQSFRNHSPSLKDAGLAAAKRARLCCGVCLPPR